MEGCEEEEREEKEEEEEEEVVVVVMMMVYTDDCGETMVGDDRGWLVVGGGWMVVDMVNR
jgi:hypothetical protein